MKVTLAIFQKSFVCDVISLELGVATPPALFVLPTGAGEPKRYSIGLDQFQAAQALANDRIAVIGNAAGRPSRAYIMNVNDGKLQPITPEFSVHQYEIVANDMPVLVTPLLVSLDGSRLMIKDGAAVSSICIMPRDQKVFLRAVGLYVCANVHSNRTNTLLTVNDSLTEKARFIFGRCLQAAYPARCGPHQLLQLAKGTAMMKHPRNELGRNP